MRVEKYILPLRILALFIAGTALVWEMGGRGAATDVMRRLIAIRGVEVAVALAVFLWTFRALGLTAVRAAVWLLGFDVVAANLALMGVLPSAEWEALLIIMLVLMGAALVAPWPWRWQAALAGVSVGSTLAVLWRTHGLPTPIGAHLAGVLVTVGGLSVLGTMIGDRQRRVQEASELRYRILFDAAGDAIAVLGTDARIQDANMRLEMLLARPVAALRGTAFGDYFRPEGVPEGEGVVDLLQGLTIRPVTIAGVMRRADGRAVTVEGSFVRMPGLEGPVVKAALRDVTDRRALEERRVQEQRIEAIGQLAAGLAHQFNNLLGGILNQATLLRRDAASPEVRAQLDAIAHAARRGERLAKELVRFTPHAALALKAVSVSEIVTAVSTLARSVPEVGELRTTVAPDLPRVAADADHLVHGLMELVFNAARAMRDKGVRAPVTLEVSTVTVEPSDTRWRGANPGAYVTFAIGDTGVGMDPATRERLFQPFFTTRPMYEAEGLGLASVYWVVRAHHGSLVVDTEPDVGTTVRVIIPVAATPSVTPNRTENVTDGRTVLIADDEELIRSTAGRALSHFGYRVLEAASGAEVLTALGPDRPRVELVVLDVVMPEGGPALVDEIRRLAPRTRVLVSSGYGPGGAVEQMLAAGAHGFLPKPYEIAELKDAVEGALA